MTFDLTNFNDPTLDPQYISHLVDKRADDSSGHYRNLWNYFRNPITAASGTQAGALNANSRPYFQAQEVGLPPRITGIDRASSYGEQVVNISRKEVVIENDIAWRIQAMVDFLFAGPINIRSLAGDKNLATTIERALGAMLDANGGLGFCQEMALLGSVYGFVDIVLRSPAAGSAEASASGRYRQRGTMEGGQVNPLGDRSNSQHERVVRAARSLHLETVEAPRVLPILDDNDYRSIKYWIQRFFKYPAKMATPKKSWLSLGRAGGRSTSTASVEVIEILGPHWWQRYEDRQLVAQGENPLARTPIIHVQNVPLPGSYEGLSDVEPLISLQDELNTRLSDRANRVTYQSFKMYLGKGIDDFLERPVGPGQMWATQNPDASIEEFGTDSGSPSEESHIEQVRQAIDKVSGVPPLAAGLVQGKIGNLTSATALKVLLSGLLARTARKQLTYGAGLQQIAATALSWLDLTGILPTSLDDRRIEIHWADPLPIDQSQVLQNAQIKAQLGVPAQQILAELGYDRQITDQL